MSSVIVPAWAEFFDPERFAQFRAVVEGELARRGLTYEYRDDGNYLPVVAEESRLQVRTLARECNSLAADQWPAHVGAMLDKMVEMREQQDEFTALVSDFARVRSLLRVKVWPGDVVDAAASGAFKGVVRRYAHRLALGLAVQLDGAVSSVLRSDANEWSLTEDELFALGQANVEAAGLLEAEAWPLGGGGLIHTIFEGPYFLASHALFLERYIDPPAPLGALVGIPHAGAIVFHPLRRHAHLQPAVGRIISFASRAYRRAPRPLSPCLYWWREGELRDLPYQQEADGTLHFDPPRRFREEVLAPLAAAATR